VDKQNKLILGFSLLCLVFVWAISLNPIQTQSQEKTRDPAAAKVKSSEVVKPKTSVFKEISELKNCYQTQNCDLDQSDPRAYDFAVGKKIAEKLREAHLSHKNDPALEKLARELIKSEDGFVQEAALDILKDFPILSENLESVVQGIQESTNPLIVELSLSYLEQFLGSQSEPLVHQALNEMLTGAHLVSQSVSENILRFINPRSYPFYMQKLYQMNPQTKAYQNLKSALKEFELHQSGG
jgi:hypothetical protein